MNMQSKEEVQQKMFDLIEQWKTSRLSQKAFCLQHEVRYYVFHYWYKRYREVHHTSKDNASSFIPLQINTSLSSAASAELIFPDGRRLLFHQPVDAHFLRSLLQ